ncbi:MAG: hypothetical protein KF773_42015 [Deltaproteobacteria bacterium]|nr:hypothetical protein [Deltaproteobacteria bacterium]
MRARRLLGTIALIALPGASCSGVPHGEGARPTGPSTVTVAIAPGIGEEPWLAFRDGDTGWEHLDAGATRTVAAAFFDVAAFCPAITPYRTEATAYLYRARPGDATRLVLDRCTDAVTRPAPQVVKLTIAGVGPNRSVRIHTAGPGQAQRIDTGPLSGDVAADPAAPRGLQDLVVVDGVLESATDFLGEHVLVRRDIFFSTGTRKRLDLGAAAKLDRVAVTYEGALPDEQIIVSSHLVTARGATAYLSIDGDAPYEARRLPTLAPRDRQFVEVEATAGEASRRVRGAGGALRLPPPVEPAAVKGEGALVSVVWTTDPAFDWYELASKAGSGGFHFRSPTKSLGARVAFALPPPVPWFGDVPWNSEDREEWTLSGWRGPDGAPWSAYTALSARAFPAPPLE